LQKEVIVIEQIRRKTIGYFYQDGLAEMIVGALFVLISLLLLALAGLLEQTPLLAWAAGLGAVILTISAGLIVRQMLHEAKERITYPRTGYVAYRDQPAQGRWIVIGAAFALAVFALALNFLSANLPAWTQRMSVIEGVLLGVVLFMLGYSVGVRRFYAVSMIALLVGVGAALIGLGDIPGSAATFGVTGLVLFVSGRLTFANYLSEADRGAEKE
jgi:hypothetical protein